MKRMTSKEEDTKMKTRFLTLIAIALLAFSTVGFAEETAEEKTPELKPQTTCPVMGGKINKDIHVDYQGQRVYLCCEGCKETFKKDPEKYLKKLADSNVLLESVQTTCPVMGGKINKELYVDHEGRRVYFCCKGCAAVFEKDPEKYLKKMEEQTQSAAKKDTSQVHEHVHEMEKGTSQ